ncbi:hypothetical protein LOTGIDRAFT_107933 [Lottia gigantea]|uniref:Major facilitator superfamily (MFS) profile domain-containing protein n=1 Tax=Lottia gigantea TaxID=225164 RepID=V3Z0K2_LOTGI|nr:hypothetical protein LOTGIDRAFT_107933 [Lottia gigantea]ESO84003.1 hypothetical protein LOTGIDRAFT_107933 [Lottia gigantea]
MRFDDIVNILGGFGCYQKRVYVTLCLPLITCAMISHLSNFILGIPKHRCKLPAEFNDTSYYPEDESVHYMINISIPTENEEYSKCYWYGLNLSNPTTSQIQNASKRTKCNQWIYDTSVFTNTIVSEFNLVCDKAIYRSHANMVLLVGFMVSSLVIGTLSDIVGRRVGVYISFACIIGSQFGTAFTPNFTILLVCRFLNGFGDIGLFMTSFVLALELVGVSKRTLAGMVVELFFCVGLFLTAILAYFIRSWQTLQLAVNNFRSMVFCFFSFVPESARWLISKGKTEKAKLILRKVAKENHTKLPDEIFEKENLCLVEAPKSQASKLFASPVMVLRSCIIFFNWLVLSMVYFGLSFNVGNITGNIHVNFSIGTGVEVLAYVLCIFLLDRLGRKLVHCFSMLIGGIACISTLGSIPSISALDWITITFSMMGRFGVSAAFAVLYIFSCELFPTEARNFGLGASSFLGRIGGIVSPYIADMVYGKIGKALPLIIFGSAAIAAGLLALLLPETKNRKLPETIEDAKNLVRITIICD